MRYNVLHFFERKNIDISNILYLTRQNPLTKITFFDGNCNSGERDCNLSSR